MRTLWCYAVGRSLDYPGDPAFIKFPARGQVLKTDHFTRQGTIDKDSLAIQVGNTTAIMPQRFDGDATDRFRQAFFTGTFTHNSE